MSGTNHTIVAGTSWINGILDSFVPGYSVIVRPMLQALGFDPARLAIYLLIITILYQAYLTISSTFWRFTQKYMMSSITIEGGSAAYIMINDWFAAHPSVQKVRSLRGRPYQNNFADIMDQTSEFAAADGTLTLPRYISYHPDVGTYWILHRGSWFLFTYRVRDQAYVRAEEMGSNSDRREVLTISSVSRSPTSIKSLIHDARAQYDRCSQSYTAIHRPQLGSSTNEPATWSVGSQRGRRSMGTVVIDADTKARLLADAVEYLRPETMRWYADRGIPHRRGYLFHRPPGTGKTSFCFALAFQLQASIYAINLGEPGMTEQKLLSLLRQVREGSIILLEDIDSAGIGRSTSSMSGKRSGGMDGNSVVQHTTLTLSGLLNAIDGVDSPEGHIVVMTTNQPEALDEALVRPGRIDMQMAFTLATKQMAAEVFIRMYAGSSPMKRSVEKEQDSTTPAAGTTTDLMSMAEQFADLVPPDAFSPAEVQGFLLMHRHDPSLALEKAKIWSQTLMESKQRKVLV